ncbi:MAG: RNA-binding protein [Hadesarchaea archaeon]|nr:RNA-binding protein [Hadesarchaea archaeon]
MNPELNLSILLPTSIVSDASSLRQKTTKIGQIGRSLAIFRAREIIVYNDEPESSDQDSESKLVTTILRYLDTPQYLRKELFPKMKELKYAGLLPPLRAPHHPLKNERYSEGDYREAVVTDVTREGSILNIGLEEDGFTEDKLELGERLTVRLGEKKGKGNRRTVFPISKDEISDYWGFRVDSTENLRKALSKAITEYFIGTSRYGQNLYEVVEGIKRNSPDSVAVAFGGPYKGLFEICEGQGMDPEEEFDVIVNTIPGQGVETVRTEEALTATLALINVLIRRS